MDGYFATIPGTTLACMSALASEALTSGPARSALTWTSRAPYRRLMAVMPLTRATSASSSRGTRPPDGVRMRKRCRPETDWRSRSSSRTQTRTSSRPRCRRWTSLPKKPCRTCVNRAARVRPSWKARGLGRISSSLRPCWLLSVTSLRSSRSSMADFSSAVAASRSSRSLPSRDTDTGRPKGEKAA